MPIHKRWGTAGGNVRLLDAEVAKQIEQTGLDGAASCCSHVSLRCSRSLQRIRPDAEGLPRINRFCAFSARSGPNGWLAKKILRANCCPNLTRRFPVRLTDRLEAAQTRFLLGSRWPAVIHAYQSIADRFDIGATASVGSGSMSRSQSSHKSRSSASRWGSFFERSPRSRGSYAMSKRYSLSATFRYFQPPRRTARW